MWEVSRIIWEPIGCYKAGSIGNCLLVIHMMNAMNNLICWHLDELLKVDFKKIDIASSDWARLRISTISRSQNSCLLKKRFWWMTQLQLEENKKNLKTSRKLENSKGRGIVLIHCFSTNSLRKKRCLKFQISSIQVSLVQINILPQRNKTNLLILFSRKENLKTAQLMWRCLRNNILLRCF